MKRSKHIGSLVMVVERKFLSEDSMMPLWASEDLMNAALAGDTITVGEISGWMRPDDTGLVIEVHNDPNRTTPSVKVMVSRSGGGMGWIDSVYLRRL